MQIFRADSDQAELVGWGVRILMLSHPGGPGTAPTMTRLAGLGGQVDHHEELFAGLEAMIEDPHGYGLFVMLCDDFGGLEAGKRALALLRGAGCSLPAMLIAAGVAQQDFPEDRLDPVVLRAPLSAVSMRVGFEHALRERLIWRAA